MLEAPRASRPEEACCMARNQATAVPLRKVEEGGICIPRLYAYRVRRQTDTEHQNDSLDSHSKHQGYLVHPQATTKNVENSKSPRTPLRFPLSVLILLPPLIRSEIRVTVLALEIVQHRRIGAHRVTASLRPIAVTHMAVTDRKPTMILIIVR